MSEAITELDLDLSELRDIVHGDELVTVGSSYPPPPELDWDDSEVTQPYSVPALLAALEVK